MGELIDLNDPTRIHPFREPTLQELLTVADAMGDAITLERGGFGRRDWRACLQFTTGGSMVFARAEGADPDMALANVIREAVRLGCKPLGK